MKRYTVIDSHCDTASELLNRNEALEHNSCHISLRQMTEYKSFIQFFAAWVSKNEKKPKERAVSILNKIKNEIEINNDVIKIIKTANELTSVISKEKHGAVLAIEDARALDGSLDVLSMFYSMGVRAICLAWNDDNDVTDGVLSSRGAGLTDFGKSVVREMNRLHMIVDVSHISQKGFWDVYEISEYPFMASHSDCVVICNHKRNLDDTQIKALIKIHGMMCINIYPPFLTNDAKACVSDILRHTDHVLSLGGEHILGLGSDFDGIDCLPENIFGVGDYVKLFDEMARCGYSDELIDKITHKNMINFMERIEK